MIQTLREYLSNNKQIINSNIVGLFSFLADTSAENLTDIIALKYDYAVMFHTAENQVLHDTQTALIMFSDQLEKLYTAYLDTEYSATDGYSKTISETIQHSGTDADDDTLTNSGTDKTTSEGSSSSGTGVKNRTYDDNTLTTIEESETSGDDENEVNLIHGHKVVTEHEKTYGHKVVGSTTEIGTLPVVESLKEYVDFNRFNFYEYVADIIARYITIPAFKIGGCDNENV